MVEERASKELDREMLKYYKYQNIQHELAQQSLQEREKADNKLRDDLLSISKKVKKLDDKKVITAISSIIIKKWETEDRVGLNYENINPFGVLEVQEWFLNNGIDINAIGLEGIIYSPSRIVGYKDQGLPTYFETYGLKERIRWSKILLNIQKKLKEYIDGKNRETFISNVDKFVKRAREDGLFSVSTAHIKQYASELGIDISGQTNLLTNAVSTKLQKEFGGQEPKRQRTLTNSIKIEIFKRDNYTCQECGAGREAKLHVHHIMPFSRGGSDEMSNLITLCESCNQAIGNRVYDMKPKKG